MPHKVADGRGICHRQKPRFADGRAIGDKSPSATVQFADGPAIDD